MKRALVVVLLALAGCHHSQVRSAVPAQLAAGPAPVISDVMITGDCETPEREPSEIKLSCATDTDGVLTGLTWTWWGQVRAIGTGRLVISDTDLDGTISIPAQVVLSQPETRLDHHLFEHVVLTYPHGVPANAGWYPDDVELRDTARREFWPDPDPDLVAPRAPAGVDTFLVQWVGDPAYEPVDLGFSGDGWIQAADLRWTSWTSTQATATATITVRGEEGTWPVTIWLGEPQVWRGVRLFSSGSFTVVGPRVPALLDRVNPLGVSLPTFERPGR